MQIFFWINNSLNAWNEIRVFTDLKKKLKKSLVNEFKIECQPLISAFEQTIDKKTKTQILTMISGKF